MHRQENGSEIWNVEPCCFEQDHIKNVQDKLVKRINESFEEYCKGNLQEMIEKLDSVKFSLKDIASHTVENAKNVYEAEAPSYNDIFTKERMEEESFDRNTFKKTTLRNRCPIIRQTLQSKQKGLKKFKIKFNEADCKELWEKVNNIVNFAFDYKGEENESKYLNISSYEDVGLGRLDSDDCSLAGVIGGGIKSLIAYMRNPRWFPSRSRNAIWALYFLTDKDSFGCRMDSEFIMVNIQENQISQNYFYPYSLFSYYALVTYKTLKENFNALGIELDQKYRYAYVDSFFEYIAKKNEYDITTLQSRLSEDYV